MIFSNFFSDTPIALNLSYDRITGTPLLEFDDQELLLVFADQGCQLGLCQLGTV